MLWEVLRQYYIIVLLLQIDRSGVMAKSGFGLFGGKTEFISLPPPYVFVWARWGTTYRVFSRSQARVEHFPGTGSFYLMRRALLYSAFPR